MRIRNIPDLALVALLAEILINANKCHQNETCGAGADRGREGESCEEVLVSLGEQAEWNGSDWNDRPPYLMQKQPCFPPSFTGTSN